ncbi:MAG: amidohydrolase family protein [Ruminococcus flavefaciens]|nr:amidohydrolase family protein [Ruminococcus flavefaciens]MCM1229193.1 amidohydrolase family protein [Ruminococcus flavefaciens]
MEYFDFHTHAFTDTLAERAMASLTHTAETSENAETRAISPCTDGTLHGLEKIMAECGISRAMILPIATKPSQQTAINNWASEITGGGIFCCGTVHPDSDDIFQELERIKQLGLYGIKFHSEYQHFRPDEERMIPVYKKIAELGLFAVFHGGWDPLSGDEVLATPKSFANIAEKVPELTIISAHLGGMLMFDDVEEYIAGKYGNILFDTGILSGYIGAEQLFRIIKTHGADKILFGSDAPWDNPQNEIDLIDSLPLNSEEKELIFHKNAENLLQNYCKISE